MVGGSLDDRENFQKNKFKSRRMKIPGGRKTIILKKAKRVFHIERLSCFTKIQFCFNLCATQIQPFQEFLQP